MLNLTPSKRKHHLHGRRLDKARKKASRKLWRRDWKRRLKRKFSNEKLHRSMLPTSKLKRFIFPTKVTLVEKNRNITIRKDVFVKLNKYGYVERITGVDNKVDYTYLLDDEKNGAHLVEPLTGHIITNSRVVGPIAGSVFRNPFLVSFSVRVFKIFVLLIVSEALFPILWAYDLIKTHDEWGG